LFAAGGGAGGVFTDTVTVRVSDPPGPFAVKVYVVELVGKTCRCPWLCTAPTPLSMDISVALLMDQLNVDDWPLSMAEGSAVKLLMVARATLGAVSAACGGGGGGGGGTFLLQPGATTATVNASSAAAILEACNLSVALILNNLLFFKSTEFLWSKQAFHYYLV
jgi:hypothetical protein